MTKTVRAVAALIVAVFVAALLALTLHTTPAVDHAGRAAGRAAVQPAGRAGISLDISLDPQHSPRAVQFGFCHWRAVCSDSHSSTDGGPWVGPKRLTQGGAQLDGGQHYAGYLP